MANKTVSTINIYMYKVTIDHFTLRMAKIQGGWKLKIFKILNSEIHKKKIQIKQ